MASSPQSSRPEGFERSPFQHGNVVLILSQCQCCGWVVVGSVSETLQHDEAEHLAECPGSRYAA